MSNPTITSIDYGQLELDRCEHRDGLLELAGADTIAAGTILAVHATNLTFILFVKGGDSNGNGIAKAVLPYEYVSTGAGSFPVRAIVEGKVNKRRLVIDAQGDDSAIDAAVIDGLRDYGITALEVEQTGGALFTDEDS